MIEAIEMSLGFIESTTVKEHLRGVLTSELRSLTYWLCRIICHARASLEDKAVALEKLGELLPDEEQDNRFSMQREARVARQAVDEITNMPTGSVILLTQYNRSKVFDDYGGKDDYWMYEFDYESIFEGSQVCSSFEQALRIIRENYIEEGDTPEPMNDFHQFWNRITRYDRAATGELHANISWIVGESGTVYGCDVRNYKNTEGALLYIPWKSKDWHAWRDLSLYHEFYTMTPFKPGDIVTVDCRPFYPVCHAVVISNRYPVDCCSLQVALVNSKRNISYGALAHFNALVPHIQNFIPSFSPFYRLEHFKGALPRGERCIGELSEAIKSYPEWSEWNEETRCTPLEKCFDLAMDRASRRANIYIEWKHLKAALERELKGAGFRV